MSLFSNKNRVSKFNSLRITPQQQREAMREMKLNRRQMKKVEKEVNQELGKNILGNGKVLTKSQFEEVLGTEAMKDKVKHAKSAWQDYIDKQKEKYEVYQDELKQERIKKARIKSMKQERAEEMVRKLTGKQSKSELKPELRRRPEGKAKLSRKEQRVESLRTRLIDPERTSWQHAETGKVATVHEAKQAVKNNTQKNLQNLEQSENNPKSNWTASPEKPKQKKTDTEAVDIESIKEQAKNIPDLQI